MKVRRPSHATVVAYLALIIAVGGGGAYAAGLGKNTVGAKQLKKNAVTTVKVKNGAITAAKIKAGTLTGAQIDVSQLGTVPNAQAASTAQSAQTAQTAQVANSVAPPEAWHEVGAPGEPGFLGDFKNAPPVPLGPETVGFYKDREGVVPLKGAAISMTEEEAIFMLPPGYRPGSGKVLNFVVACSCPEPARSVVIIGSNSVDPSLDGAVVMQGDGPAAFLDGVTFRAES